MADEQKNDELGPWLARQWGVLSDVDPNLLDMEAFEAEFEREIMKDDGTAAEQILASGHPIHVARDDTPAGYVIRVWPDGRARS